MLQQMSKFWKEASSVIIVGKISFPKNGIGFPVLNSPNKNAVNIDKIKSERLCAPNFKVLLLKRSSKSSFMPNGYVFPGGNVDVADSSTEWRDLFDEYGFGKYVSGPDIRKFSKINIFESQRKDEISRSVSLRITGIRETFEESGVLLCKSRRAHSLTRPSKWASYLSGHEIQKWQKKVQENASEFISLCRNFECFPDIWSLQEWSNWLTPNDSPKRFNTIFFLVALDQMPTAFSSSSEIDELKWSTPEEVLDYCNKQKVLLPLPQFYELSRLINFDCIEELADFAVQRNSTGSELWMAVRIQTLDGEVFLLPGDDMYPHEPKFAPDSVQKVENTIMEYRRQSHKLHRLERNKEYNTRLINVK
ncbi:nucleoside diphosphate-linked moiety X motif 19 isoform X2 [Cryptotermes secundus]|uniref:nucleoside diphosphate-linked moiety X motif 19 isoform X2 n=1 Tax=Cryptotermes secundus TaxID=105785 RepID=UPI000CD7DC00|nr:nucleoside diphosphate-linked moiety X motif 19 isoform X2 [Cryptotermes secundus]